MFGQLVIGPPGSGKTTYCTGMEHFLKLLKRRCVVVNLDPANDALPYKCDVDISELITVKDVMQNLKLGPNGALIYCMEYLEKNLHWLRGKLQNLKNSYILFDCPGQVELYTHHRSVHAIVEQLQKWQFRLAAVHLVDSHYCSDAGKFISVLLTSLTTMLQIELPHVNLLSKADLIEKFGKLAFNVDYYTEVLDLHYLLQHLQDDPVFKKYRKMNEALVNVVEDYSLVSFVLLDIQDRESVMRVLSIVDKANGYVYGGEENRDTRSLLSTAVGAELRVDRFEDFMEKNTNTDKETDKETDMDADIDTDMEAS